MILGRITQPNSLTSWIGVRLPSWATQFLTYEQLENFRQVLLEILENQRCFGLEWVLLSTSLGEKGGTVSFHKIKAIVRSENLPVLALSTQTEILSAARAQHLDGNFECLSRSIVWKSCACAGLRKSGAQFCALFQNFSRQFLTRKLWMLPLFGNDFRNLHA